MTIKTQLFPATGKGGRNISLVKNIASDVNDAATSYAADQGVTDTQGLKLPGLSEALGTIKGFKEEIGKTGNEVAVRIGLDEKGNLVMTVAGILPRKGKPAKIDEEVLIRKGFADLVEELANQKNAVVNLQKGDTVIDRATSKQATKFNAKEELPDDAEFGEITTGNVILAAHGSRTEVSGKVIGTKLGKKTAAEIVELLTSGDKKMRLNPKFSGTVWLSGCFTASGGIAPPGEDYDYESFASAVWNLLKKAGYKNATVKGQPGQARTDAKGDKSSVTPTGQKDYDRLKKQLAGLEKDIKTAATELAKIKTKHGDDEDAMRSDPGYVRNLMLLSETKKLATTVNAEKELHVIKKLVATYGLSAR